MSITATIIKDSVSPYGERITTYVLEYPRFVHAELMTHRVFSKNAASSRAIPVEKMIQQVIDNPAMPVWWGKNQSGMQAKEELDNTERKIRVLNYDEFAALPAELFDRKIDQFTYLLTDKEVALVSWFKARGDAIKNVRTLLALNLHKQIANRILEPWFNIRIILTGTEFENFFALRCHPDAQPEIQELAYKMRDAYHSNTPEPLGFNGWHIPFGDQIDDVRILTTTQWIEKNSELKPETMEYALALLDYRIRIAIARCARISYLTFEGKDDYNADLTLCDRLFGSNPKHLSPTEHVAFAARDQAFHKNYRGWVQFRAVLEDKEKNEKLLKVSSE